MPGWEPGSLCLGGLPPWGQQSLTHPSSAASLGRSWRLLSQLGGDLMGRMVAEPGSPPHTPPRVERAPWTQRVLRPGILLVEKRWQCRSTWQKRYGVCRLPVTSAGR